MKNAVTDLLGIEHPIIQGGMVWVSGGKLAAAVSCAGGLGLVGAGSMQPDLLHHHLLKAKSLTDKPIGVNIPLLYEKAQEQIDTALNLGIKIFFTSAGSPKKFTAYLKDKGAVVVHVTSSPELAIKCQEAGVDAVVAEGFEAGGHNGRDEITTLTLIPQVCSAVSIPVIAAGGIADGRAIAACMALGASGVQLGTRFLMTKESSAHDDFKKLLLKANSASTKIQMKATVPVRLFQNQFARDVEAIEQQFTGVELKKKLQEHLGKYRAKKGMLEGDLENGELEVGQIVSLIKNIPSVDELMKELIGGYEEAVRKLKPTI